MHALQYFRCLKQHISKHWCEWVKRQSCFSISTFAYSTILCNITFFLYTRCVYAPWSSPSTLDGSSCHGFVISVRSDIIAPFVPVSHNTLNFMGTWQCWPTKDSLLKGYRYLRITIRNHSWRSLHLHFHVTASRSTHYKKPTTCRACYAVKWTKQLLEALYMVNCH